jgi:hypothetical protein
MGRGVSVTPRPLSTPGKDPVPTVREAGLALGLAWTGADNLTLTGIRSPDRPARNQSLYRLSYPAQPKHVAVDILLYTYCAVGLLLSLTENRKGMNLLRKNRRTAGMYTYCV